jgi:Acetyltransferase (GNAT) domain
LATGRISNIVSAQRRAFLSELARLLSASGWLALSRMVVGDRPIAWNYGFQFRGSWFWYQPTFDPSYEQLSLGHCLLSQIVSEACDKADMRVVDLGLGAEEYKERFASGACTLHATFTKSLLQHLREVVRYYSARAVKVVPGAESTVRAVLAYIGRARRRFNQSGLRGCAAWGLKQLACLLNSYDEVVFYQWRDDLSAQGLGVSGEGLSLRPVALETLAVAAMSYEHEGETLGYLLRSASRLHSKTGQCFALVDPESTPVHFCWVRDFEGFKMEELKIRLSAPNQNAAMIFDCWTPQSKRGRGYYRIALSLAARLLSKDGKEPWVFSVATNHSSRRGIERAGFERRYSMICRKTFAWHQVSKVAFDGPGPTVEAQVGS